MQYDAAAVGRLVASGWLSAAAAAAALTLSSCFYPPLTQPNVQSRTRLGLAIPYDLAWDAVLNVIKKNDYRIHAQDPAHGIVEAESPHFTLNDADCGVVRTAVGNQAAEPTADASAVFNFYVAANGNEAATISIQAVFSTPVRVPFHPLQNVECASRGLEEARLLNEVREEAATLRRPEVKKPG